MLGIFASACFGTIRGVHWPPAYRSAYRPHRPRTRGPGKQQREGHMPQAKLTPAFTAQANFEQAKARGQANADRVIYWDESLPGFGLMLTANGHRSYVCQYRANGASRRMTIKGSLPLSAARKQAKALQGDVAKGKDPLGEKRKAR